MINIIINRKRYEVKEGLTVIQACLQSGYEIPRFCYHEKLAIAGNCRMCLVSIKNSPKPVASCAMPVQEGMEIETDTEAVRSMREGVMEFLLINHPLDCPICDQGGECDLQDQAMMYGRGTNRFLENKRSVKEKDFGPLIKTHMNRCIHCTRCVRFLEDIAGTGELATFNRGEYSEIDTHNGAYITSELSGNIIDLCPVGALTSKPYAFHGRPWELKYCETIDISDAVGSAIRLDYKGTEVMRILPRLNEEVNQEWISDKARFSYDGLNKQRIDAPYIRDNNGKLKQTNWQDAISLVADKLKNINPKELGIMAGKLIDCESMFLMRKLAHKLGCHNIDCRHDLACIDGLSRCHYVFNTTISGIMNADLCLLIGTNPRTEAPIINAKIRERYIKGDFTIANIGTQIDTGYDLEYLGDSAHLLTEILNETHDFCNKIKSAKYPMLIIGQDILTRSDGEAIFDLICKIAKKFNFIQEGKDYWNGFNMLHKSASKVGGMDLNFLPSADGKSFKEMLQMASSGEIKILYLLGVDEVDLSSISENDNVFIIYQGHHGDHGASIADLILPGCAFSEKYATYINTEGRVQNTQKAVKQPGEAKDDCQIILNIASELQIDMDCNTINEIRQKMYEEFPTIFHSLNKVISNKWEDFKNSSTTVAIADLPIYLSQDNFYSTDVIARNSRNMINCIQKFTSKKIPEKEEA